MAIDNAQKRASALGVGLAAITLVVPSGAITDGDKQTICSVYSGILADAPIIITPDCFTGFISSVTDRLGFVGAIQDDTGSVSPVAVGCGFIGPIDDSNVGFVSEIIDKTGFNGSICNEC